MEKGSWDGTWAWVWSQNKCHIEVRIGCWFSSLLQVFSLWVSWNQHSKFQFKLETVDNKSHRVESPWINSHYISSRECIFYVHWAHLYLNLEPSLINPTSLGGRSACDSRKNEWCSTPTFQSRFVALKLPSLKLSTVAA